MVTLYTHSHFSTHFQKPRAREVAARVDAVAHPGVVRHGQDEGGPQRGGAALQEVIGHHLRHRREGRGGQGLKHNMRQSYPTLMLEL